MQAALEAMEANADRTRRMARRGGAFIANCLTPDAVLEYWKTVRWLQLPMAH